jgi:uncharacterized lipoprotein YddW (UPF0748 family)
LNQNRGNSRCFGTLKILPTSRFYPIKTKIAKQNVSPKRKIPLKLKNKLAKILLPYSFPEPMKKIIPILLLILLSLSAIAQEKMPKVAREFRGMWIATVANIDFPSAPNLTVEQQKAEIVNLMNLAQELKMNAVIFQVRPMADALYQSEIEPSSWFLTGQMGKKLDFDPLKFAIDEAHSRGILLHAWFNPYRVSHVTMKGEVAENHITKLRPDLVKTYNKGQILDPGEKDTQDYVSKVVLDVVRRYDIDAVHFDDYFYPYKDANQSDFPDDETYKKYKSSGGKLGRDDWRRKNVDDFIQNVAVEIKKIKPTVMFGISPFGIWKPNDIDIKGTSAYDTLYADSRKWLQEGWVDYLAPQLYWSSKKEGQKFPVLLNWWRGENKKKRHLWVGIAPYKVGDEKHPDFTPDEIVLQIDTTRGQLKDGAGAIHFSAKPILQNNSGIRDVLREKAYRGNALIPETPWITTTPPVAPELSFNKQTNGDILASWKNTGKENAFRWILYWDDGKGWKPTILPPNLMEANLQAAMNVQKIGIASVDRLGNISTASIKEVK